MRAVWDSHAPITPKEKEKEMKSSIVVAHLLIAVFLLSVAAADETRIVTITDAGAQAPGVRTVRDFDGVMPDGGIAGDPIVQMPGWPITIGGGLFYDPARGLALVDMNDDGDLEIIASGSNNMIHAWNLLGQPMPGFPVTTTGDCQYAPSVADMDGDGDIEIVQSTRGLTSGGRLYAIDHQGNVLPGFPKNWDNNNVESCPALYDLDGDGTMEIVSAERDYPIGYLHVVEPDGSEWGGNWPFALDHVPACTPAVGDVDNDGQPEIVMYSYDSIYVLNTDGTLLPGWPKQIPGGQFSYQSPALADLDGDDDLEIVVGAHSNAAGVYVFHHTGASYPGWPKLLGTWTYCPPTVADLDGDGSLEILDGRAGSFLPPSDAFWAWTSNGQVLPGFPFSSPLGGGSEGPLTVADIDGDGAAEIFADSNLAQNGNGFLYGVDSMGNNLPGFPLRPTGFTYLNGAMIADVDNDGDYELAVISSDVDVQQSYVNLYDLPQSYGQSVAEWPTYHARNAHDGLYGPEQITLSPGDCDGDAQISLADYAQVQPCMTGPFGALEPDCGCADLDGDGDSDSSDVAVFMASFEGM